MSPMSDTPDKTSVKRRRNGQRSYSAEDRAEALAVVAANGGNVVHTANQLAIPRGTLETWVREQAAYQAALEPSRSASDHARANVEVWRAAQQLGAQKIVERLEADGATLKDVAYASKVSSDAYLDHRDGRKGTQIAVDARTVTMPALDGDQLRQLLAALAGADDTAAISAIEAAGLPVLPASDDVIDPSRAG